MANTGYVQKCKQYQKLFRKCRFCACLFYTFFLYLLFVGADCTNLPTILFYFN